ncbi:hypothetical protein Anas_00021 [Armadillidium nasatum]|uniref:N-acetyltransferase domain-containing protein n=1 Tax=Armadillidium nasatum TaxID=96803 RepID=A0A5N5T9Z1_9CRUS|nr:hypothetical protein Anas_00021 [Armadillidium nasatum]
MADNERGGNKFSPSEFKIVQATMDHVDEYKDLVAKHFCTREQLSVGLHVPLEENADYFGSQMEKWMTSGTSVAAIHTPTNRLAGVSLTTILTRDNQITFNLNEVKKYGKELQNLVRIAGDMEKQVNLFGDPKIDKILEIAVTTVDPEFSGNKITYRMTEESERLAKERGCQIATAQSTNKITQHIRRKMGYEVILSINYDDMEIDGEKVIDLNALNGSLCGVVFKKYL